MKRTLSHMLVAPGLALCLVLTLAGCGGASSKAPEAQAETTQEQAPTAKAPSPEEKPAEEAPKVEEAPKEDKSVPAEYRSALSKAQTYSDRMHMSKQGVYDQLTSEYGENFSA